MSEWGPWCQKCGHPSGYHGVTFCMVDAGADHKKRCDCDGYEPIPLSAPKPEREGEG